MLESTTIFNSNSDLVNKSSGIFYLNIVLVINNAYIKFYQNPWICSQDTKQKFNFYVNERP